MFGHPTKSRFRRKNSIAFSDPATGARNGRQHSYEPHHHSETGYFFQTVQFVSFLPEKKHVLYSGRPINLPSLQEPRSVPSAGITAQAAGPNDIVKQGATNFLPAEKTLDKRLTIENLKMVDAFAHPDVLHRDFQLVGDTYHDPAFSRTVQFGYCQSRDIGRG